MKIPNIDYFELEEFVHPWFIDNFGERALLFLRPELIKMAVNLRERYGPTTINNWHVGGSYTLSGLRPLHDSVGAKNSLHKYGCAGDFKFRDITVQEVHADIVASPQNFPEITRLEAIESTPTWLHADCANTGVDYITVFNP